MSGVMFNKPICILLSGKAGTGKTTVANLLRDIFIQKGYKDSNIYSFAKGVKDAAFFGFGWDGNKDEKGRTLLQDVGRIGRKYNKDIWVSKLEKTYLGFNGFKIAIIDDWRFPNEYGYLKNNTVYSIYKVKIISPDREILKGTPAYDDVSETSLDDFEYFENFDFVIYNNCSMEDLNDYCNTLAENILNKEINNV
jgi:DNA polymerase III delta prime subunit